MFFIHGGDYVQGYGGGPLYDGTAFSREFDLIVVSTNYRLGALGFLYTGDDPINEFTGNFGLLDQRLAMQWVQANAARFGGDPAEVTIFGQSAGGMSVASHLTMKASAPLFKQAIIQSDPLALPFRHASEYPAFSRVVAEKAGCTHAIWPWSKKPFEPCLRELPATEIVQAQHAAKKQLLIEVGHFLDLFVPYSPVVGTEELPMQPLLAMENGVLQDKPIILGTVANEGVIFSYGAFPTAEKRDMEDAMLGVTFGVGHVKPIIRQYPRSEQAKAADDMRNHTANVSTGGLFTCAARHAGKVLAHVGATPSAPAVGAASPKRRSSTWIYEFEHVPSFGPAIWLPNFRECLDVVCHSAELPFLWLTNATLYALTNATFTAGEARMAQLMKTYWAHFALHGTPGSATSGAQTLEWPDFGADPDGQPVMHFNPDSHVSHGEVGQNCPFWDGLGYDW